MITDQVNAFLYKVNKPHAQKTGHSLAANTEPNMTPTRFSKALWEDETSRVQKGQNSWNSCLSFSSLQLLQSCHDPLGRFSDCCPLSNLPYLINCHSSINVCNMAAENGLSKMRSLNATISHKCFWVKVEKKDIEVKGVKYKHMPHFSATGFALICCFFSAERRWLFSPDQGSTYLLCQLMMYEGSPLFFVTKHEVFVLFFLFCFFSPPWAHEVQNCFC